MPKRRLVWHLFPSYALVVIVTALGVGWTALWIFESSYLDAARADLETQARFLAGQLAAGPQDRAKFIEMARAYHEATGARVALVHPRGRVEFDTQDRPQEFESQRNHPEIEQALAGTAGYEVRDLPGLDWRVLDLAVPINAAGGQSAGALYLSVPLDVLDSTLARARAATLAVTALCVALALALAWRATRSITLPLEEIRRAAAGLAGGTWTARAVVPDERELSELTEAFNHMADRLQERISVLIQHNNEQKAVLASMAEGVLAVDSQECVISMNRASSRLLGLDQAQAQGRPLQEVVRNADLSRFITRALACSEPIEADVLLHGDRERVMQAHGSGLHDLEGRAIGAVVVLNDVTDFRRLEHIRRDFVANVSHELKTPVTSIKGFVETLLDGAIQDPVDAERFLRIIAKQADRLHAIIEDLLSLSKIEQSEDAHDIVLESAPVRGVLESALNVCQAGAAEKHIDMKLDCDPALTAKINPLLLEQAVVNLVDNAVKYSESGREVRIAAAHANGEVTIAVADHGCGIASQHLTRVFERFYRVDRARSRKLGGTGLGLAIVKHIVQAHHGRVTVESTLGIGSTFTIHLPRG